MATNVREILTEAKTILTEKGWTQGSYVSGDDGERCYCLGGAIWKAATGADPDGEDDLAANRIVLEPYTYDTDRAFYDTLTPLAKIIGYSGDNPRIAELEIYDFNDDRAASLDDVIKAIDDTLETLDE